MTTLRDRRRRPLLALAGASIAILVAGSILAACGSEASVEPEGVSETTAPPVEIDLGDGPRSIEARVGLEQVADGLDQPVAMTARPMRNELWIAERPGRVRVLRIDTDWNETLGRVERRGYDLQRGSVLDISGQVDTSGEGGLLGIAFSTDASVVYLSYTDRNGNIALDSYRIDEVLPIPQIDPNAPPPTAAPAPPTTVPEGTPTTLRRGVLTEPRVNTSTRVSLMVIPHPDQNNHNGGQLALGRDGYLYMGVGDGGGSGDPNGNAQNPRSLLGKILRIDPSIIGTDAAYSIPPNNPFADGVDGAPEVWSLGLRNPWRFSFDSANGDLWIGDVGERDLEEIDWLPAWTGPGRGANLGWNWFEGDRAFRTEPGAPETLIPPIYVYDHTGGACAVIGGYVYRGSAIRDLAGVYIFGDYCTGEVRGLLARRGIVIDTTPLGPDLGESSLTAFGQDDQGELYVVDSGGSISRLVPA